MPDGKDKLIKSEVGFEKYFLNSLRILVGMLPGPTDLCVLRVPRISSTSFSVVGDIKKEFLFAFFKYESKDFNTFDIFVTRFLATDVKKLLN